MRVRRDYRNVHVCNTITDKCRNSTQVKVEAGMSGVHSVQLFRKDESLPATTTSKGLHGRDGLRAGGRAPESNPAQHHRRLLNAIYV